MTKNIIKKPIIKNDEVIEGEIIDENPPPPPDEYLFGCKTGDEEVGNIIGYLDAIFNK